MDPLIGDRIVVRYRLGAGGPEDWRAAPNPPLAHQPTLSDVTGVLRGRRGEALVIEHDGAETAIPLAAVTSVRLLSAQVVRNAQIRTVQGELSTAVGGAEDARIGGWALWADPQARTPRGCAAIPLEQTARTADLAGVAQWYADRGLTGWAILPERIFRAGDGPEGGSEFEALTAEGRPPAEAAGDDTARRRELRAQGYRRHHGFRVVALAAPAVR